MVRSIEVDGRAVVVEGRAITPTIVSATWVDNFDDESLAAYSVDTGEFGFVDDPVISGAALQTQFSQTGFFKIQSLSGNGLDNYLAKGETSSIYVRSNEATSGADTLRQIIDFGMADTDNYYEIALRWDADDAYLRSVVDGGFGDITNVEGVGFSADTWLRLDLIWDDGTLGGSDNDIDIDIVEVDTENVLGTLSGNNNDHATAEGVGLGGRINTTTDTHFTFDQWEVTSG